MSETIVDVQSVFSSIAYKYDRLNTLLSLNVDQVWRKKAVKLAHIQKNNLVLDLCCGTGKMVELECRAVGVSTKVVGLDFNSEMLHVGNEKLNLSLNKDQFMLIQGDAIAIPFEDNSFHCVTIAFGLRNVPNKRKAISEMYRVLKPGGKVVCLELSKAEVPVLRTLYNLYFNFVLPFIGYLGTRDKAAYYYLRDSVNGFMTKNQLKNEFITIGFENSGYKSLTCGVASIHYGVKPL